jgi:hypothetical protein
MILKNTNKIILVRFAHELNFKNWLADGNFVLVVISKNSIQELDLKKKRKIAKTRKQVGSRKILKK